MPDPILTFEGTSDADNQAVVGFRVVPPDTNGDIGPNHYVQWNNLVFEIFDKDGNTLVGPLAGNALFAGFGGPCETTNNGDPTVLYDQLADRWVLSQFAIAQGTQCVAVSQTGDPTGAYYRYAFVVTPGGQNDYPKMGIWPDAYYSTYRRFPGATFAIVAAAMERDKMLAGDPTAGLVTFVMPAPAGPGCTGAGLCYEGVLPAHLEGMTPPPAGTPNYFVMSDDDEGLSTTPDGSQDFVHVWEFSVDWTTPANSTFTGPVDIPVPEMDINLCGFGLCVPQQGVGQLLDHLSFFTMWRAVYRNFGSHESLWINNTVNLGANRAGIRWAEVRDPGGSPVLHQTGTHGPDDGLHRWMGSLAVDKDGNMALGYSTSGTSLFPSIRYAGRLAADPLGMLPQTETEMYAGTGSQTGAGRWGDYSAMSLDDNDGCTFWYTTEYYETTGGFDFKTRIGAFKFPSCDSGPSGIITGTVTDASTTNPIAGATVQAGVYATSTNASGVYQLTVPVGMYDVTASAPGYEDSTVTGVDVTDGAVINQDFALTPLPIVDVTGTVVDGSGAGWPLYARVVVTPTVGPIQTVYTDPLTGQYSVTVFGNATYGFAVTALVPGYQMGNRTVVVGAVNQTEDFALLVDPVACTAPGYGIPSFAQADFSSGIPAGWTVVSNTEGCTGNAALWSTANPGGRANLTGGSGPFAVADSDICGPAADMDTELVSPAFDLSGFADTLRISFNSDYRDFVCDGDNATTVEVWNGSAWVILDDLCGDTARRGPRVETYDTTAANGAADAQVRLRYQADWDWWWEVDNVRIADASSTCQFGGGGVILGNVTDANTSGALNGAVIALDTGESVSTAATPADPGLDDGFYMVVAPAGDRTLTASKDNYGSQMANRMVAGGSIQRQDFALPAGQLSVDPAEIRQRLKLNKTAQAMITVNNTGTADATFDVVEVDAPAPAPLARPAKAFTTPKLPFDPKTKEGHFASLALSSRGLTPAAPLVDVSRLPIVPRAGDAVSNFDTGLVLPWGAGYNTDAADLWVGDPAIGGGDDLDHRFLTDGTNTGDTIDTTAFGATWAADMTYDTRRGTLWQVAVGGDNCLHEADPVTMAATGERICAAFGTSMRGVAYNPVADTFFVGTWNGNFVVEVDRAGTILRSKVVGLLVSGLAFNGRTGHLFAQVNSNPQLVYVLDVDADFAITTAFPLLGPSGPAFLAFEGAGLELDCNGVLWAPNQVSGKVFASSSGETNTCVSDIPWFSATPESGSVSMGGSTPVTADFTSTGIPVGCYEAQAVFTNDTPYGDDAVALGLTVQYNDVNPTTKGDAYIHALAAANVTHGCASGRFCPTRLLSRSAIAVWLLRSKLGPGYAPPPALGIFADVSPESFGADYIEDAYNRGIIENCNPAGALRFCPNRAVKRGELAVYLLRTLEGTSYVPPPCAGLFRDVKCTDPMAPFIEDVFNRGFMAACVVRPTFSNFCPKKAVPRWEGAEADAKTFGIPACKQ